ncbi:MAG TPA: DNA repair protein [Ruminococcus sp.]|nr:DNA repair protein [Ruminococcus sp.]
MRPLKLKMEAFGSYGRETVIDFTRPSQNLFLITGDTGSGKSTIFDALVFALYGATGSSLNKKDGRELQSQFVGIDVKPYVELTFTEMTGGEEEVYKVRREPRHMEKKSRVGGWKQVTSSVSLTMPDGTVYPAKETDEKLTEIVGLTREQFMQVAMIAQGEFMELIRSGTEKRKEIFRRLFGTGIYNDIVEELDQRRKALEDEMGRIRAVCIAEAGRISIPEGYEGAESVEAPRSRLTGSKKLNVVDMEEMTSGLEELCGVLEKESRKAWELAEKAGKERDRRRDVYTKAETLRSSFEALDKARREIEVYKAKEGEMKEAERLRSAIRRAYGVKAVYSRYAEAAKAAEDTERNLREQKEAFHGLVKKAEEAVKRETEALERSNAVREEYTKTEERVNKSLEILGRLSQAEKRAEECLKRKEDACKAAGEAEGEEKSFDTVEKQWKVEQERLSGAEVELVKWQGYREKLSKIRKELDEAERAEKSAADCRKKLRSVQERYNEARERYIEKNGEYQAKRTAFYDSQAGILAAELEDGKPCPVCGSLSHPSPAEAVGGHTGLTRELIEELRQETERLAKEQNDLAQDARSASDVLKEKEEQSEKRSGAAAALFREAGIVLPEGTDLKAASGILDSECGAAAEKERLLSENAKHLAEVAQQLGKAGEMRRKLREKKESAEKELSKANAEHQAAMASVKELAEQKDFDTEQEACGVLSEAGKKRDRAVKEYEQAASEAVSARDKAGKTITLIGKYEQELPELTEKRDSLRAEYDGAMTEAQLAESEWKDITGRYNEKEPEVIEKRIAEYNRAFSAAKGAAESAEAAVGSQQKPDMEALRKEVEQAERAYTEASERSAELKALYSTDKGVLDALGVHSQERKQTAERAARIERIYRRLAGKETAGRMDIETRVQRLYLENILVSANRRFREMSAGQFELRMTEEAAAAQGSNKGLDLMVYSNVTGTEREIRTLSGGESFMAALSLALGMSDQIQQSSASVNLDIMFIDEGFGSLDDHSRSQAIKVLRHMAGSSRLIGIISHVTELKQQIDDRLVVEKDSAGSHIHWVIS